MKNATLYRFAFTTPLLSLVLAWAMTTPQAQAAPANDNQANAAVLTGDTPTASVDNTTATEELGDIGYRTLWWKWTAPGNGRLAISTINSTSRYLRIMVYLRETSGSLSAQVANNLGTSLSPGANSSFPVVIGATYMIRVGNDFSSTSHAGTVNLSLTLDRNDPVGQLTLPTTPTFANNTFASRITLSGSPVSAVGYNFSATEEAGEPINYTGYRTLWYTYRPSANGRLSLASQGSDESFTKYISVFQGSSVNALKVVGRSDYDKGVVSLAIPITAGVDYQIALGSSSSDYGGSLVLTLALDVNTDIGLLSIGTPASTSNDNFANRIALSGQTASAIGYNLGATLEALEPTVNRYRTLWWSWTPTADGNSTIDLMGSDDFEHFITVWTGSSVSTLTSIANSPRSFGDQPRVTFAARAGTTYQIAIGDFSSSNFYPRNDRTGSIVLTIAGPPAKPSWGTSLNSLLLAVGPTQAVTFNYPASGGGVTYQWLKDSKPISGATGYYYSRPLTTLTDAGAYVLKASNSVGYTLSNASHIGLVDTATKSLVINEGGTLKLIAPAAGPGLSYRWRKGGTDLVDSKVGTRITSGTGTATLSVNLFTAADAGSYTCLISMADPLNPGTPLTLSTGAFTVTGLYKPVMTSTAPPAAIVSKPLSWQLAASGTPTRYIVTGLPTGITYSSATGLITGTPSVAASLTIKAYATNAAGNGLTQSYTLAIAALPTGTAGSYTGWLSRRGKLNASLGGFMTLNVTSTGSYTGTLKWGAESYPLKWRLLAAVSGNPTALMTIPRKSPAPALTVTLTFDPANNAVTGEITDGVDPTYSGAVFRGKRTTFAGTSAAAYAATYNCVVDLPAASVNDAAQPLGTAYEQLVVKPAGSVAGTGRTADGIAYTFSNPLWPDGTVPHFALLYAGKGSLMGLPKITLGAALADHRVTGWVDTLKDGPASAADRTYKTGIPYMERVVDGAPWIKPTTAFPIVLGKLDQLGNSSIVFAKGNAESAAQFASLAQTFRINKTNSTTFAAGTVAAGNPCKVAMTITPATGLFTGSFTLTDTVAGKAVPRVVKYAGILLSHRGKGYGYFTLPGLLPGVTTSDIFGGRVTVN